MQGNPNRRRHGQGSLYERNGNWYGHWRANGRQVKRKLGAVRQPGSKDGLTERMAERELQRRIEVTDVPKSSGEALTVMQVSVRYCHAAKRRGVKNSTLSDIESQTRVHFGPFFKDRIVSTITPEDVQDLVEALEKKLAPKSVKNIIGTLSALFNYAKRPRNRWASINPCEGADINAPQRSTDIRFLKLEEVEALIAHTNPGPFEALDKAIFLTAAMTGMRKGELLALRWKDVDWAAARVRVRQNYVRGEFGTPKSKRSTRSIPLADEVAGELHRLWLQSRHQSDEDLVFGHPGTGAPLPVANVTRRMKAAMRSAGLNDREYVFHDLRHTFGTHMAASGVALRTIQEWMGHRDITTTQIYADYSQSSSEAEMVARAFRKKTSSTEGAANEPAVES